MDRLAILEMKLMFQLSFQLNQSWNGRPLPSKPCKCKVWRIFCCTYKGKSRSINCESNMIRQCPCKMKSCLWDFLWKKWGKLRQVEDVWRRPPFLWAKSSSWKTSPQPSSKTSYVHHYPFTFRVTVCENTSGCLTWDVEANDYNDSANRMGQSYTHLITQAGSKSALDVPGRESIPNILGESIPIVRY